MFNLSNKKIPIIYRLPEQGKSIQYIRDTMQTVSVVTMVPKVLWQIGMFNGTSGKP